MHRYEAAWLATQGARRYQEDAVLLCPDATPAGSPGEPRPGTLLALLADGMGGHSGGAIASRTACEAFVQGFAEAWADVRERLMAGLGAANAAIERTVVADPRLRGMGSTLVGASFGADGLEWVSVGDSPLYLVRGGEIALLNEDHSLAPALDRLALEGQITEEQARNDPRRHLLRSAVTGEEIELVDLSRQALPLEPGDHVLIASDGIHTLEPSEIARIVSDHADDGPAAIAAALIRAVESRRDPRQDNTTVVVVRPARE
jgi:serine/threonine protein phosphatase PrpC